MHNNIELNVMFRFQQIQTILNKHNALEGTNQKYTGSGWGAWLKILGPVNILSTPSGMVSACWYSDVRYEKPAIRDNMYETEDVLKLEKIVIFPSCQGPVHLWHD